MAHSSPRSNLEKRTTVLWEEKRGPKTEDPLTLAGANPDKASKKEDATGVESPGFPKNKKKKKKKKRSNFLEGTKGGVV